MVRILGTSISAKWSVMAMLALTSFLVAGHSAASTQEPVPPSRLLDGGYVLMLRHALAPGTGDPSHFALGDCSTQRNLDDAGRRQARKLGEHLRAAGVTEAKVYTSQWCRCRETAELLNSGPVEALPALNSFYQRPQDREGNLRDLRALFAALPPNGPPVVMVTHQVTITAITEDWVSSGQGVVLRLDGTETPLVIGPLEMP